MTSVELNTVPLADRFSPFQILTYAYKRVDEHSILVDVLVPKKLVNEDSGSGRRKEKRPVIIRIHGGWLVGGQRNYAPWFPPWILELALKHDAIVVAPDYRLLPEAKGVQILDDLDGFWGWLGKDLDDVVYKAHGLHADLDKVLVEGESAGGYLALQVGLSHFKPLPTQKESGKGSVNSPKIRVLVSAYPMLNVRAPHWTKDYHKDIFELPQYPNALIDEHLAAIKSGKTPSVLSNVDMEETPRNKLAIALVQRGRVLEVLGEEIDTSPGKRRLHPEDRVEDGSKLPPTLFLHGIDDTGVPVELTDKFIELLKRHRAVEGMVKEEEDSEVLHYTRVPGEHAFEKEVGLESTEWMKKQAAFTEKHWLG